MKPYLRTLAILATCAAILGCPLVTPPVLFVSPLALHLGATALEENFTIVNTGGGTLTWTVETDVPGLLTLDVASGETTTETDRVTLTTDRTGLSPGTFNGTITISSNGGSETVNVAVTVGGTPTLDVDPLSLTFLGNQESATFTISNMGDGDLFWSIALVDPSDPTATVPLPDFLTVTPLGGFTPPGGQSTVSVEIDRDQIAPGILVLTLLIDSNAGTQTIDLTIDVGVSGEIGVDPAALDFGTESNVLALDVFNSGPAGSVLDFVVSTDRPDLIFLTPTSGSSTGTDVPGDEDRVTITVTIDRGALTGPVDSGTITVTALGLDPLEVPVMVEAAPLTFEGAQNRTRPPFILRFIFILRDSLGLAVDSNDPAILEELQTAFSIEEDGEPLDIDETEVFVTNASNLRYNVVLMLDFTASMFHADPGDGAVIEQMVASSRDFVADLPDSYRIAITEYHERQQTDRLIHDFSTAKQPLLDALDAFTVPPGEHGASEVRDAIVGACTRLADEDVDALPFDDADVRALVFISDGRDTSSIYTLQETIDFVKDQRVRLYPIGFGDDIDSAVLIRLATETGGHFYPAPTVTDLVNLLEHELTEPVDAPGLVVKDLSRQVVLTYLTLFQEGTHTFLIRAELDGQEGFLDADAVYAIGGDVRAGQIGLRSAGIQQDDTAEVFVRTEYVPRNISQIRFRFITDQSYTVELAPEGLLSENWTLENEGAGVYTALTTEDGPLRVGSFGDLLKLRFEALQVGSFELGFRVDNRVYVDPPFTKFFQYPDTLTVGVGSSQATVIPILLDDGFDPDAPGAFDRDGDSVADFEDLFPDDPNQT